MIVWSLEPLLTELFYKSTLNIVRANVLANSCPYSTEQQSCSSYSSVVLIVYLLFGLHQLVKKGLSTLFCCAIKAVISFSLTFVVGSAEWSMTLNDVSAFQQCYQHQVSQFQQMEGKTKWEEQREESCNDNLFNSGRQPQVSRPCPLFGEKNHTFS